LGAADAIATTSRSPLCMCQRLGRVAGAPNSHGKMLFRRAVADTQRVQPGEITEGGEYAGQKCSIQTQIKRFELRALRQELVDDFGTAGFMVLR
jgi:hypothetical protein